MVFSEPMDPATTVAAVSMEDDAGAGVLGVALLSANGMVLAFQPAEDLAEGVTYTVTVAATAEDVFGNALGMDYVFTFTTWPPAVTPFAGGCSAGGVDTAGWTLALAAALGVLAFFHRRLDKTKERRKERNMVRRTTLLVMAVTLPVLVFSAAAEAEGATAEETAATTPAGGETKPAAAPAPANPAAPVAPAVPGAPAVPTTGPEIAPVPEVFAEPRARRFGIRAGMFVPTVVKDETYSKSFTGGAFYAGELPVTLGLVKLPFEIGLDFSRSDSDDGRVNADFYALRLDLLFSKWESLYLLGGYQLVLTSLVIDGNAADPEYVSAFNVGFGLGPSEGRWDARVAYSILVPSGNIRGLLTATAALRF